MGYSAEIIRKIKEDFENRRRSAIDSAEMRKNELCSKHSSLAEIEKAVSMTGLNILKASLAGTDGLDERIERVKAENAELIEARTKFLENYGYPADYLDIKFSCCKCSDTGYVGIKMCSCMKKALVNEAYNRSGLGSMLKDQTFKNFDLSYYANADDRSQMEHILEIAKKYAANFGKAQSNKNLLFTGTTGLGKTHITTAIAKAVIDKGYEVVYDTAQNIVRAFQKEQFEKNESATLEAQRYFDCDLLIIDDLGTEFINSFTQSCLYNLLNSRINSDKAMIISTNLDSTAEFIKLYDERISSRIIGTFFLCRFAGKDIRLINRRKEKNYN